VKGEQRAEATRNRPLETGGGEKSKNREKKKKKKTMSRGELSEH